MPVPNGLDTEIAALTEPMAVALHAVRRGEVKKDQAAVVIGCGPIGLLTLHAARTAGADVVVVEPVAERRAVAAAFGAPVVLEDVAAIEPGTADLAVDAVGLEATWQAGIGGLRPGGELVLVGLGQDTGAMPVADLVRRGIVVRGHFAYTRDDFSAALRMLADDPPPDGWVDVVPLAAGADAFARLSASPPSSIKILLEASGA
jgi:threonine dehydrogenase-like Zn-dependent dehydrogenase